MPSSTIRASSSDPFPEVGRALILVVLVAAVYLPSVHAGILWDDDMLCSRNLLFFEPHPILRIWFTTETFDYFPLTYTMFYLEWLCFGEHLVGWHVVNIALHAIDVALLYIVLRQLRVPGAWLAALLFGIHPVNAASVTWISQGKNTLSLLFYLLTTLCYLRWDRDERAAWGVASLTCFTAALLSKTSGVLLPFVLLACTWWRGGRIERRHLTAMVPFAVLASSLAMVTVWFQHHRAMSETVAILATPATRIVAAGWIFWFYCVHVLVPIQSMMIYPLTLDDPQHFTVYAVGMSAANPLAWLPAMLTALLVIAAWRARDRWGRPFVLGLTHVIGMLLPCMGLVAMSFTLFAMVSDHLVYLASIGIIALPVGILTNLAGSRRAMTTIAAALLTLGFAVLTLRAQGALYDRENMWRDTIAKNPASWVAWFNLGSLLEDRHDLDAAIDCYRRAVALEPHNPRTQYNLAHALAAARRSDEAIDAYRASLAVDPAYGDSHNNLGTLLEQRGELAKALVHYRAAVMIDAESAEAHNNLGALLARMGQPDAAIRQLQAGLRLQPDNLDKADLLAGLLAARGQTEMAARLLGACLAARPDDVDMRVHLGALLCDLGRLDEAEKTAGVLVDRGLAAARQGDTRAALGFYRAAVAADSHYAMALNDVAWVLATARDDSLRNPAEAIELASRACEEVPDSALFLDTLAAAYAANGDFDRAAVAADRGLAAARAQGDTAQVRILESRRALYRAGRDYRE